MLILLEETLAYIEEQFKYVKQLNLLTPEQLEKYNKISRKITNIIVHLLRQQTNVKTENQCSFHKDVFPIKKDYDKIGKASNEKIPENTVLDSFISNKESLQNSLNGFEAVVNPHVIEIPEEQHLSDNEPLDEAAEYGDQVESLVQVNDSLLCKKIELPKELHGTNWLNSTVDDLLSEGDVKFDSTKYEKNEASLNAEHFTKLDKTHTRRFKCNICDKLFKRKTHIDSHLLTHFEPTFGCEICGKKYKRRYHLKDHIISVHTNEKHFECTICNKCFSLKYQLQKHQLVHTTERFPCEKCKRTFKDKSKLNDHYSEHFKITFVQCTVCKKEKSFSADQMSHSSKTKLYTCEHCKEELTSEVRRKQKLARTCTICNRVFERKQYLLNHKWMHTGVKQFECEICKIKLSSKSNLVLHRRIHSGDKQYQCDVCGKQFIRSGHLAKHKATHSSEKPFKCNRCNKGFANNKYFKAHTLRGLCCNICKKNFRYKVVFDIHMKGHAGQKDLKCTICGKIFKTSMSLRLHQTSHSEFRPFKCETCGKCFERKTHLTSHHMTHTNVKPLQCEICNVKIARKGDLNRHIVLKHCKNIT